MSHDADIHSPGQWGCWRCGAANNFAWRSECRKCGGSAPSKWQQWQKHRGKAAPGTKDASWPAIGNGPHRVANKWWGTPGQSKRDKPAIVQQREKTPVERCVELLALAKSMEDPELVSQAETKLEIARAQRDAAVAPSIRCDRAQAEVRRLESRMVAKRVSRDEAGQELAVAKRKYEKADRELAEIVEQLGRAQEILAAAAQMAATGVPTRPVEEAAASVQRMGTVLQAAATATPENLTNLFESLRAIHTEMVRAIPAASEPPVTQEERIALSDGEEDEFLDEFMQGVDGLDPSCTGDDGCGARTEQCHATAKRVLRKALVKVRAKRG